MKIVSFLALALLASACSIPPAAAPAASASSSPVASASPSVGSAPATTATPPALRSRALPSVPGGAKASPDGRWIAVMEPPPAVRTAFEPAALLFSSDGTLVRKLVGVSAFSWLPDSSGLFAAITIAQRAPDLWILELDGRLVTTQIQLANETLTRDSKWIVAEHQEGCCVAIVQREIRVSSRDGRVMRTLVRSEATEPQPVVLIGVDAVDRVVYRDG